MKNQRFVRRDLVAGVLCAAAGLSTASAATFQRIAYTGDAVVGGVSTIVSLGSGGVVINNSGTVAFSCAYNGFEELGVVLASGGTLSQALRNHVSLPGMSPGKTINSFGPFNLSDSGRIIGHVSLIPSLPNATLDRAVVTEHDGAYRAIAQTNAPFTGGPQIFRNLAFATKVNASGQYLFSGQVDSFPATHEVWMGSAGTLTRVVGPGMPASGYGSSAATFQSVSHPTLSDTGRVAFFSTVRDGSSYLGGQFISAGGVVQRLAGAGLPVPGVPGAVFSSFVAGPSLSKAGDVAMLGTYTRNGVTQSGIWRAPAANPTMLEPVVLTTDTLPQTPANSFTSRFSDVTINQRGSVAFEGTIRFNSGADFNNDSGVWIHRNGELRTVVREGGQVPGMANGYRLAFSVSNAYSALNARDQMVFACGILAPGVETGGGTRGLFGWDPDGGLVLLARVGQQFDIGGGELRTISTIGFSGSQQRANDDAGVIAGGTGGTQSGLNDSGVVVMHLGFVGGTSGIFTTTIPAPSTGALFGLLLFANRRRRRRAVR